MASKSGRGRKGIYGSSSVRSKRRKHGRKARGREKQKESPETGPGFQLSAATVAASQGIDRPAVSDPAAINSKTLRYIRISRRARLVCGAVPTLVRMCVLACLRLLHRGPHSSSPGFPPSHPSHSIPPSRLVPFPWPSSGHLSGPIRGYRQTVNYGLLVHRGNAEAVRCLQTHALFLGSSNLQPCWLPKIRSSAATNRPMSISGL